ncbi:hypothetical protein BBF96_04720 [Anoxybacter fermentans]|uniref:DUF1614 domain-containing protein n=1 Tax=Anoxybacter fermentans TaxID=1323375 RepID=A0A3Q9HPX3_9FIRM|nr:DUF1614 domain-containing protein [Anoxybacter fermentans]AZR72755.1 hypothetical protein BBF96_04720 [Anoxybacter fermentans]
MPIGVLLLIVVGVLIFFGFVQRILDRLYLTDKAAILFIVAMIAGSFINIPISPRVTINVGGGIIPIILAGYVLSRAGTIKEWVRAIVSTLITGAAIYFVATYLFFNAGHTTRDIVDPQYVFAIIGGIIAYIAGRSRRSAFIAGVLGFLIYNLITLFRITFGGISGSVNIGGAGIFDTMVISGLIAVAIAEVIGETRERLGGGPIKGEDRPEGLKNTEYAGFLGKEPEERRKRFQVKKGGKKDE